MQQKSFETLMEFDLAPQIKKMERDIVQLKVTANALNNMRRSVDHGSTEQPIKTIKNPFGGNRNSLVNHLVVHNGVEVSNPAYVLKKKGLGEQKERKVQFDI